MAKEGLIDLVEGLIAGALLEVLASTNSSLAYTQDNASKVIYVWCRLLTTAVESSQSNLYINHWRIQHET
jgi:hypothetical protein